jgi:hypothetical protein
MKRRTITIDKDMAARKARTPREEPSRPTVTATIAEMLIEKQCARNERRNEA